MEQAVEKLQRFVDECENIVFFGGAGVSTESGIPDFRSVDGLYNQQYDYPPETILSHSFFMRNTGEFFRFYSNKMLYEEALDADVLTRSVQAISEAQMLIIGGTSLAVYPAASLIDYFRGKYLVVINKSPTPRDKQADLLIQAPIGETFAQIEVR